MRGLTAAELLEPEVDSAPVGVKAPASSYMHMPVLLSVPKFTVTFSALVLFAVAYQMSDAHMAQEPLAASRFVQLSPCVSVGGDVIAPPLHVPPPAATTSMLLIVTADVNERELLSLTGGAGRSISLPEQALWTRVTCEIVVVVTVVELVVVTVVLVVVEAPITVVVELAAVEVVETDVMVLVQA